VIGLLRLKLDVDDDVLLGLSPRYTGEAQERRHQQ
jgi:hypothetical protein